MIPYITPQPDYVVGPAGQKFRNLESEVAYHSDQINAIIEGNIVLGELGIRVVGQVEYPPDLPSAATYSGDYGDAYLVGTSTPYNYYIFTRPFEGEDEPQWFNLGKFPVAGPAGPRGETGPKGDKGDPGQSLYSGTVEAGFPIDATAGAVFLDVSTGYLWRKNDLGAWSRYKDITGPAGPIGPKGNTGPTGPRGETGPIGPMGPSGFSVEWNGPIPSISDLPPTTKVPRNTGYIVRASSEDPVELYIISRNTLGDLVWMKIGGLAGLSTVVYNDGSYLAELDITDYLTSTDVDQLLEQYLQIPSGEAGQVLIYNGDNTTTTRAARSEKVANTIALRDERGNLQVSDSVQTNNDALCFSNAKPLFGINTLTLITSSSNTYTYSPPTTINIGWTPASNSAGTLGYIDNFLFSDSLGTIGTPAHIKLWNCTDA